MQARIVMLPGGKALFWRRVVAALGVADDLNPVCACATPDALLSAIAATVMHVQRTDGATARTLMRRHLWPHIDAERIVQRVMPAEWAQSTRDDRDALLLRFQTWLLERCATELAQDPDVTITVQPSAVHSDATEAVVEVRVNQYLLRVAIARLPAASWCVHDVRMAGTSVFGEFLLTSAELGGGRATSGPTEE